MKLDKQDDKTKNQDTKSKEKKSKDDKSTKSKKDKGTNYEPKGKSIIIHEDKWTQIPEEEMEIEPEIEIVESPKPGDLAWDYLSLRLPEEFETGLATLWEHVEDTYIEDLKQVFFMKRIMLDNIQPFVVHVKKHMKQHILKPDEKQVYLSKFQQYYNEFDDDIRTDQEFKAELHCRVNEMKERLLDICERRMMEAEDERKNLIKTMWVPRQLIELINNYICAFQLELDRCIDTILILNDFYAGIITQMPCDEPVVKELLPKVDLENSDIQKNVNNLLTTVEENKKNPFKKQLEDLMDKCLNFIDKNYNSALSTMEKFKNLFHPVPVETKEKKTKKNPKKGAEKGPKIFEPEQQVKENHDKIFAEWETALKGEHARVNIYFKLLQADLVSNLDELLDTALETFHGIFEQIKTTYKKEKSSVVNACNLLEHAIEAETRIQEELLLKADEFCVDFSNVLFTKEKLEEKPLLEPINDLIFTVNQLEFLMQILFDLAPEGFIAERSMVYLLQDMITKDEDNLRIPKSWIKLCDGDIEKFATSLFGDQKYIAWKQFIICNFMIPYPSVEELLDMRVKYLSVDRNASELITNEEYNNINLWFEVGYNDQLRVRALKQLLFKLYQVNDVKCNYSAMLLDFCKGKTNVEGFAKALSLVAGKNVCWNENDGQIFVEDALEKRRQHEEEVKFRDIEIQQHTDDIGIILTSIIDQAVHNCESFIIEDAIPEKALLSKKVKSKERIKRTPSTLDRKQKMKPVKDEESTLNSIEKLEDIKTSKGNDKKKDMVVLLVNDDMKNENYESRQSDLFYEQDQTRGSEPSSLRGSNDIKIPTLSIFSNIPIGFESTDIPSMMYFITFELIQTVLSCILPEYVQVQNIEDKCPLETIAEYFNEFKNPEFNNEVLAHEFLNSSNFKDLLDHTAKFVIKNPVKIVDDLIKMCNK